MSSCFSDFSKDYTGKGKLVASAAETCPSGSTRYGSACVPDNPLDRPAFYKAMCDMSKKCGGEEGPGPTYCMIAKLQSSGWQSVDKEDGRNEKDCRLAHGVSPHSCYASVSF